MYALTHPFAAMLEMEETPKRTGCCLLVDKEEIGSVGATGMQSRFFENSVAELLDGMGCYSELALRRALRNSSMLSSDVVPAMIRPMVRLLRKRMQHILDAVSFLISSPGQEENPVPTMPMQSTLQEFAGFLMITMLLSRQQSLEG